MPLRIGIDLDGVLIDHSGHKIDVAKRRGFALECWQTNSNVMGECLPNEVYTELQQEIYTDLTVDAPAVKGAIEAVRSLDGEMYIVSARRSESIRFAQKWLLKHGMFDVIPADRMYFCGSKNDKREICDRLGMDMFIDDQAAVLNLLSPTMRRVLFDVDGVANKLKVNEGIHVASTWDQAKLFLR